MRCRHARRDSACTVCMDLMSGDPFKLESASGIRRDSPALPPILSSPPRSERPGSRNNLVRYAPLTPSAPPASACPHDSRSPPYPENESTRGARPRTCMRRGPFWVREKDRRGGTTALATASARLGADAQCRKGRRRDRLRVRRSGSVGYGSHLTSQERSLSQTGRGTR